MPATAASLSPIGHATRAASKRVNWVDPPRRPQSLPLKGVGNTVPHRHAHGLLPTLPQMLPSTVPVSAQARFQHLLDQLKLTLTDTSSDVLRALRDEAWAGTLQGQVLSESDQSCLAAGLTLHLLEQSGVWNEGIGDLLPLIVNVPSWPAGRALRIVDSDHDAIHLYRPGEPELCHRNGGAELPAPAEDEIVLLRHERHFSLIRRDQEQAIEQVADDGDCFFSCISRALKASDVAGSNHGMRLALADHIWNTPELLQVAGAQEGRLPDTGPPRDPQVSDIPPPPREASSASTESTLSANVLPVDPSADFIAWCTPLALDAYHKTMDRLISEDVYGPAALEELHHHHSARILSNLRVGPDGLWPGSARAEKVRQELDTAFAGYQATNTNALNPRQEKIKALHETAITTYIAQIDEALETPKEGESLPEAQARIRAAVEDDFCTAIVDTVHSDEPFEGHLAAIRAEIEAYWTDSVIPRAVKSERAPEAGRAIPRA
ncbi:hypothetical protein [Stenotrophomonas sp. CFBP 13725]|uniref:hypothetical protein n=1 Tax=Stenotrophomonas sp. CFBP 13725 TaxID=2775297 RepID=UPI00177C96CE|nr:hypothetical protein [Stenotrophomonas sp. CFBP 13725]MBD8635955.1 hypothetical protein [Stenotrophomonas sp. CFBP 13725]